MVYIDKNRDHQANPIIDKYLKFAKKQKWYCPQELYNGFRGSRGKHRLIDTVLMPEQSHLCCYCLKRLGDHADADVTIEHIIRRSIPDAASMTLYFHPLYSGLNAGNVCHSDDFVRKNLRPLPYPHHVAYHNMAIACRNCNSARGHQDVYAPFLFPNIGIEVKYDRSTGKATWANDPHVPSLTDKFTLDKLNLNSKLLKAIRAIWLFGKDNPTKSYSTPDTVANKDQRRDLIYRAMGEAMAHNKWFSQEDLDTFLSLMKDGLWNELLKYDYFASIP